MDALNGSAAIATSNSPISIFSPGKRRSPCRRRLHLVAASKDNEKDSDLSCDGGSANLVPFFKSPGSLTPLSNDAAMGLVLRAATGNGWTTDSGMEGPPVTFKDADSGSGVGAVSTFPWSLFTKSPRRRMRVAFTCNVCGQRTTRAINPHAYTDGTVFVQCCGCNVFHKLVDNLNLFHEMKCYVNPSFRHRGDAHFDFKDEDGDNIFPVLGELDGEVLHLKKLKQDTALLYLMHVIISYAQRESHAIFRILERILHNEATAKCPCRLLVLLV